MRLALNSGTQELLPCYSGHLPVRFLCRINLPLSRRLTPASSWEFFTTFDYEFSIIRGRRPYRKTIWVGLFLRSSHVLYSLGLNTNLDRFTPSPALPPL